MIALSTMEAKYMVVNHCAREAIWLRQFLADVRCNQDEGIVVMYNNQGAILLAKNLVHHTRTKHIDIQHHFIREKVERRVINLEYYSTEHMMADGLTKVLARNSQKKHIKMMGSGDFGHLQSGSVESRLTPKGSW
jgi:hypothetical protein